jgi:hypothetical protein
LLSKGHLLLRLLGISLAATAHRRLDLSLLKMDLSISMEGELATIDLVQGFDLY